MIYEIKSFEEYKYLLKIKGNLLVLWCRKDRAEKCHAWYTSLYPDWNTPDRYITNTVRHREKLYVFNLSYHDLIELETYE